MPVVPGLVMAVLLLSLPNLVPAFWPRFDQSQAESFFIGGGLILLPCVFSMTVRWALFLWLPLAALIPLTIIYWFISGGPLREWAFVVFLETNWNELERFWPAAIAGVLLAGPAVWCLWHLITRHVPEGHRLSWPSRIVVILFVMIIPMRHFAQSGSEFGAFITQRKATAIFPPGLVLSAWNSWKIRRQLDSRVEIGRNIEVKPSGTTQREIYILVIGESARYASFQLNGYDRETTPLLAENGGLLNFQDVAAPATVTLMSVPVLLTPSTAESLQSAPTKPSVVSIFRGAGFHTAWFSTQRKHGMYDTACSIYSKDAHESAFLSGAFAPATGAYESALDGELLEPVQKLISRGLPKTFIVLHTMGSHQHYSDRFPPEFERFKCGAVRAKGSLINAAYTADEQRLMTNAFDNSILYTDWLLSQLVEALGSTHAVSALFYVSDHGQNTGNAAIMPFGHGTKTEDVIHVPMLMWISPEYRIEQSARAKTLASHVSTPFSADTTFHTLVDMAGLDCMLLDRTKSAASDAFKPGRRIVRSMEGALSDYDELKLRWKSSNSP